MKIIIIVFALILIGGVACTPNRLQQALVTREVAVGPEEPFAAPTPDGRSLQPQLGNANINLDEMVALLPPDAIPAILPDDVPNIMMSADAADAADMGQTTRVIWVSINGESRAYPIPYLSAHEIVNDVVGGQPIAATWRPLCYTGIVYDRQIAADQTLTFGVSGMLYRNGLIMYDHQTESLWSHILGQAIGGEFLGTQLTFIPVLQTSWQNWKQLHPDTLVVSPALFGRDGYDSYYISGRAGVAGRGPPSGGPSRDDYIQSKEFVVGVRLAGQARAYPFSVLNNEPVINDQIGGVPVAVFFDKAVVTAAVFNRRLTDGTVLTFAAGDTSRLARDMENGSDWDVLTGTATSGPLQGTQLEQVPITYAFWFGWINYHAESTVYGVER